MSVRTGHGTSRLAAAVTSRNPGRLPLAVYLVDQARGHAHRGDQGAQHQGDQHGGDDAGHHQSLDHVESHHFHGLDLLADGAGAQVRADGRAADPGQHERADQRRGLPHHDEGHDGARVPGRTQPARQLPHRHGDEHADRQHQQQRGYRAHAGDEQGLVAGLGERETSRDDRAHAAQQGEDRVTDQGPDLTRQVAYRTPARGEVEDHVSGVRASQSARPAGQTPMVPCAERRAPLTTLPLALRGSSST